MPPIPPWSRPKSPLFGLLVAIVPAVVTLEIPGGRLDKKVDASDIGEIFVATAPWTASIALVVWLLIATADEYGPFTLAGALAILAIGALLAPSLQPEFVAAAQQAANAPGEALGEHEQFVEDIFGDLMRRDPRAAVFFGVIGGVLYILAAYWFLYGPALWLTGLLCGAYIGRLLHEEFSEM